MLQMTSKGNDVKSELQGLPIKGVWIERILPSEHPTLGSQQGVTWIADRLTVGIPPQVHMLSTRRTVRGLRPCKSAERPEC